MSLPSQRRPNGTSSHVSRPGDFVSSSIIARLLKMSSVCSSLASSYRPTLTHHPSPNARRILNTARFLSSLSVCYERDEVQLRLASLVLNSMPGTPCVPVSMNLVEFASLLCTNCFHVFTAKCTSVSGFSILSLVSCLLTYVLSARVQLWKYFIAL